MDEFKKMIAYNRILDRECEVLGKDEESGWYILKDPYSEGIFMAPKRNLIFR